MLLQGAVSLYAPPTAERVYVGKRGQRESIKQASIDEILVQHALQVLRPLLRNCRLAPLYCLYIRNLESSTAFSHPY